MAIIVLLIKYNKIFFKIFFSLSGCKFQSLLLKVIYFRNALYAHENCFSILLVRNRYRGAKAILKL